MKFVSVRDLRGKAADIWRALPGEREMVITSNGRPGWVGAQKHNN